MKKQNMFGIVLLVILLISGAYFLESIKLFYRLLIGLSLGYVMARASIGFAGSINNLVRTGSSNLAKTLMIMFTLTAVVIAFFIYGNENSYRLGIHPINMALVLGGLMFGFGMTFTSCCATGSLTDLSSGFSRALVTVFFLSMGVFFGFFFQTKTAFVKDSYFSTTRGLESKGGVFLPDLFLFDGFQGYLGAVLLTGLLAYFTSRMAQKYEQNHRKKNSELKNPQIRAPKPETWADQVFTQPWSPNVSVVLIALLFGTLLHFYAKGWGATTAFGLWFAKILLFLGVSADALADFTGKSTQFITTPLYAHGTSIQNFGIILGAFFYLAIAGKFKEKFIPSLSISKKDFLIYAFGGFIMGFGTRLSNGCNVGALYTSIAEFSLSGWLYLIVVAIGGFTGNWVLKNYINKTCVT